MCEKYIGLHSNGKDVFAFLARFSLARDRVFSAHSAPWRQAANPAEFED
jgi:hypothetical protein